MFKGQKVFTKNLNASLEQVGAGSSQALADASWLMEEDIEIIGIVMDAQLLSSPGNDGFSHGVGWLSQSAEAGVLEGRLAHVGAQLEWNTAPAFGTRTTQIATLMLPPGYTIQIKEEGHLYLNMNMENSGAGNCTLFVQAIVYYVKRGQTR